MFLIVGLGNPGSKYEFTRHNIGFLCVDFLAEKLGFPVFKEKGKSLFSKGQINGEDVILLKPQTFMNLSGQSVLSISSFFKIPTENIIVIQDEIDLPFASVKVKFAGGHAGHNGLRSIDLAIGKDYHRIRCGVDHPKNTDITEKDVADYVLEKFNKEEIKNLQKIYDKSLIEVGKIIGK